MDRQAFKQRMQNLKSYRENNPGKGYWDWRNSLPDNLKYTDDTEYDMQAAYEAGVDAEYVEEDRSYHLPTRDPKTGYIFKKSTHPTFWKGLAEDAKLGYDAYFLGDKVYTKSKGEGPIKAFADGGEVGDEERQYISDWYSKRKEYAKHHVPAMLKQLNAVDIYVDPNSRIRNIYSTPISISDDRIKQASKESSTGEYGGYYHPNEGVVLPSDYKQWKDREPLLHELNHVVNTFNTDMHEHVNKVLQGKKMIDRGEEVNSYLATPSEVQSRLMEFRKLNNLDPTKVYGIPNVREWRRTGKDADLLNTFDDDTVLELINTVAHTSNKKVQRAADGGEISDPEKERFYQATGRSSSGRPLEEGLKPVFDLEDAANMTPIGDAISAKDTYNAVMNRDWLGAGLAAATMIPFVPMTVKQFRGKYRGITPKSNYGANSKLLDQKVQRQIDALATERARREAIMNPSSELTSQANNEGYRIIERLMEDPSYLERAREVKRTFGDDYTKVYSDLIQDYNITPDLLPKSVLDINLPGRAKMRAKDSAQARVNKGGTPPGRGEFEYAIDPLSTDLTGDVTLHELNHYTDFVKNKSPHADANSNLFYQMNKDMDGVKVDAHDSYFKLPTEQKAYMNQLREYLFNSGKINRRNDKVSSTIIKQALEDIKNKPEYDSVIRASKQFKSLKSYTKWFNTVPLLSATTLGANAYFNNEKNK